MRKWLNITTVSRMLCELMPPYPVQLFAGTIRPLPESGRPTGMYKNLCTGEISIGANGIETDRQADLRVHGGPEKAVHLYPAGHYRALAKQFPEIAGLLIPGCLGENISVDGLDETQVRVGDIWQLGSAHLQLCQPRNPCWKIDERLGIEGVAEYIARHFLTGWYWRVVQSGTASPTDPLIRLSTNPGNPTLRQAMELWSTHRPDMDELERLCLSEGIAVHWQNKIRQRLSYLGHISGHMI